MVTQIDPKDRLRAFLRRRTYSTGVEADLKRQARTRELEEDRCWTKGARRNGRDGFIKMRDSITRQAPRHYTPDSPSPMKSWHIEAKDIESLEEIECEPTEQE